MSKKEVILFCPLNWGLGHATRIVPIIKKELLKDNTVIIAASGNAFRFLKKEFPNITTLYFNDFNVRYWKKPFFIVGLLVQMPLFFFYIFIEHLKIQRIIKQYGITTIISDNRYGMFSKLTRNIIITHQLFIKLPYVLKIFEPIIHLITRLLISKFDECWVPDYKDFDKSIGKELSHGKHINKNVRYINPISRFKDINPLNKHFDYFDILILISGPEPVRTEFEITMENRFKNSSEKVLMVCGKPKLHNNKHKVINNITKLDHLNTEELFWHLKNSKHIICRSGYSSLMDLHVLNRCAELHPTKGQSEQEYLYKITKKCPLK